MSNYLPGPDEFEELLPLAAAWAEEHEKSILTTGLRLSEEQLRDARAMGVSHPERVRLSAVTSIPTPEHPVLRAAAEAAGLFGPFTAGLSLRYGIYIRQDFKADRFLVAHELVHTAQYERAGGMMAFLRQYLQECLTIGYPDAPMEQEAILTAERLRDSGS